MIGVIKCSSCLARLGMRWGFSSVNSFYLSTLSYEKRRSSTVAIFSQCQIAFKHLSNTSFVLYPGLNPSCTMWNSGVSFLVYWDYGRFTLLLESNLALTHTSQKEDRNFAWKVGWTFNASLGTKYGPTAFLGGALVIIVRTSSMNLFYSTLNVGFLYGQVSGLCIYPFNVE
eukprot:IDg20705t1